MCVWVGVSVSCAIRTDYMLTCYSMCDDDVSYVRTAISSKLFTHTHTTRTKEHAQATKVTLQNRKLKLLCVLLLLLVLFSVVVYISAFTFSSYIERFLCVIRINSISICSVSLHRIYSCIHPSSLICKLRYIITLFIT